MPSWKSLFRQRTEDWVYTYLDADQVPDNTEPRPVERDSYLSVSLKSARVVNVRKGLSKFYGTVHSYASVPHLSGTAAEFQVVTTPSALKDADAARIDRVIQLDQRLLGPVPYRGGDLELEIGLFSIQSVNFAAPYISLLESLSKAAGVAFISAAVPFVEPLRVGINLLLGGNDSSILEIGLASSAWAPRTGFFVIMRAPRDEVEIEQLRVRPDDYRLVDSSDNLVGDFPYMVFKAEASPTRDDWFLIPEVSEAYNQLNDDIRQWKHRDAEQSLIVFKRTVLTSGDLLEAHARTLAGSVEAKYTELAEEGLLSADQEDQQGLPALSEMPPF